MIGERHEKKTSLDSVAGLVRDAREVRKRPRRVLSEDGSHVLNIWFIPHYNELLVMYKVLDDDACVLALRHHLIIAGTLHDMMQYLCAHANLGTAQARLGSTQIEFVSSDWGGFEGVGAELREIQEQMGHIPNTPEKVGNFLKLRRDVMFLEFEVAIKYNMRDTMLSMGNKRAYKVSTTHFSLISLVFYLIQPFLILQALMEGMHFGFFDLSSAQRPSFMSVYLNVPEPLEARDPDAERLFPWRAFHNKFVSDVTKLTLPSAPQF